MAAQLNEEIVNDTAKLIMHRLIARSLKRNPSLISSAIASCSKISDRFPDRTFVAEWEELLGLSPRRLRALLVGRNEKMKRLRQSSPFILAEGVDFSDVVLRRRIRRAARRIALRRRYP